MRYALSNLTGQRGTFTAAFLRYGFMRGYASMQTALFVDLRDGDGHRLADHFWLRCGTQIRELRLRPLERVKFVATVEPYLKDSVAHIDWRLRDHSNMQRTRLQAKQREFTRLVRTNDSRPFADYELGGEHNHGKAMPAAGMPQAGARQGKVLRPGASARGLQRTQEAAPQTLPGL